MASLPKTVRPGTEHNLPRARIDSELARATERPLTWLSGSAGSGKTSAVAGFLSERQSTSVWLHLDADDADPGTFFHYLKQAVLVVRKRARLPRFLPEHYSGLESFARRFFRDMVAALPDTCAIVLDNYEVLPEGSELHVCVRDAVLEAPPGITWVIASRVTPPPVFSRVSAADKLSSIDGATLRFSLEETELLVRARLAGRSDASAHARKLHAFSEGWVAGIVLALQSKQLGGSEPTGSGATRVFDYFASELLEQLPESERAFLATTALLPQFTARQAEALTGFSRAEALLEELTRNNYFISRFRHSLPAPRPTYRYHPLFRQFLLEYAARQLVQGSWDEYRSRAADLLVESDQLEEAVHLLGEAGQHQKLAELVRRNAEQLLADGRHETLGTWLAEVPESVEPKTRAWLFHWKGRARLPFAPIEAQQAFDQAFRLFSSTDDDEGLFLSWAGAAECLLYGWGSFRDFDFWIDTLEELLKRRKLPSLAVEGRVAATMHGALMLRRPAHASIDRWEKKVRRLLFLSRFLDADSYALLALNLFQHDLWRGRTSKTAALLRSLDGMVASNRLGPVAMLVAYTLRSVHGHFTGDGRASVEAAEAGLAFAENMGVHFWDFLLLAQAAFGAINCGDFQAVHGYVRRMQVRIHPEHHLENLLFYDAAAQLALAESDVASALDCSERAVAYAMQFGALFPEAALRIGRSHVLFAAGRHADADAELDLATPMIDSVGSTVLRAQKELTRAHQRLSPHGDEAARPHLEHGFRLCREHGYHGFPWWRPAVMAALCESALRQRIQVDFVRELVTARTLPPQSELSVDGWPWRVKVLTLGRETGVFVDGEPLRFERKAQRRPMDLLHALIALGGSEVDEAVLAEALWTDSEGDAAIQAVATTLHRLRRLIGNETIVYHDRRLSLDFRHCFVDSLACSRIFADSSAPTDQTLRALALYRGRFLEHTDAPWALEQARALSTRYIRATHRCADQLVELGDSARAIELYEQALEHEPGVESLHRALCELLVAGGRRDLAADAYRRCEDALRRCHGSKPTFVLD